MTFSTSFQRPSDTAADRLEIERLIGEVARRHNVLLSRDDPILVTVTLNELILAATMKRLQAIVVASQDQIAAGTAQQVADAKATAAHLITEAADYVAGQVRAAVGNIASEIKAAAADELHSARQMTLMAQNARVTAWWAAVIAIVAAAIAGTLAAVSPLITDNRYPLPSNCRPAAIREVASPSPLKRQI